MDEVIVADVVGGVSGAFAYADIGRKGQGVINAGLAGINTALSGGTTMEIIESAGVGFVAGYAGGSGAYRSYRDGRISTLFFTDASKNSFLFISARSGIVIAMTITECNFLNSLVFYLSQ